jgi:hypothetical protein
MADDLGPLTCKQLIEERKKNIKLAQYRRNKRILRSKVMTLLSEKLATECNNYAKVLQKKKEI